MMDKYVNSSQKKELANIAVRYFNNRKLSNSDRNKLMKIGMNAGKKFINQRLTK